MLKRLSNHVFTSLSQADYQTLRLTTVGLVVIVALASCAEATTDSTAITTTTETTTTETTPVLTDETPPDRALIEVTSPFPGDLLVSPATITGFSNTFEATVNYRLLAGETVIAEGFTMGGSGSWAPFSETFEFTNDCCIEGALELFEISAQDGSEINKVTVPITFPEQEG